MTTVELRNRYRELPERTRTKASLMKNSKIPMNMDFEEVESFIVYLSLAKGCTRYLCSIYFADWSV